MQCQIKKEEALFEKSASPCNCHSPVHAPDGSGDVYLKKDKR